MKKILPLLACVAMLGSGVNALADSSVTVTVDGKTESRDLVRITFDGDNAVLHFADSSTEAVDMTLVTVALTHDEQSAVERIMADPAKAHSGIYNLKGQRMGDTPKGLAPGIYIINGQKVLVK